MTLAHIHRAEELRGTFSWDGTRKRGGQETTVSIFETDIRNHAPRRSRYQERIKNRYLTQGAFCILVTVQRATGSCRASAYEMGRKAAAAADMPRTCMQPKRQCVSAAGAPRFSGSSGAVGLSRHGSRTPDTRQTLSWVKSSVGRCSNPARLANRALAPQALWYVREHERERKRVWEIVERIQ